MIVVADRPPNFMDALDQTVLGDGGVAPHGVEEFGLGDQPVRVFEEEAERREGLRPKRDRIAAGVTEGFGA